MPKTKPVIYKGYAIFRAGYWLVCPTYTLAVMENKGHKGIVEVELREVKNAKSKT